LSFHFSSRGPNNSITRSLVNFFMDDLGLSKNREVSLVFSVEIRIRILFMDGKSHLFQRIQLTIEDATPHAHGAPFLTSA
jgi:hypothetical protein